MNVRTFKKAKTIRAYVMIEADGTLEKSLRKLPHLWTSKANAQSWVDSKGYPWTKVVAVDVTIKVVGS